jgi:hypothetical protein
MVDADERDGKSRKVQLYEVRGETSVFIDAEINERGSLVVSGQDVGKAPKEYWGDSDYEYWVVVAEEHKDRLRRALTEREFGGDNLSWRSIWKQVFPLFGTVFEDLAIDREAFAQFLTSKGIPFDESSGVIGEEHKDALVLALMERAFGGRLSAERDFLEFLKSERIPYQFDSWV